MMQILPQVQLADNQLSQGAFREAEQTCREGLTAHPRHLRLLLMLGVSLAKQERRDEAIAVFREAIDEFPESAVVHSNLGAALLETGDPESALPHLQKAVALRPDSADYQANLAACHTALGGSDEAVEAARRAAEIDSDSPERLRSLAKSLADASRTDEAVETLGRHLQRSPADAESWFRLSEIYARAESEEQAIAACRRTVALDPNHPQAALALGQLLLRSAQTGVSQKHPLPEIRRRREEAVLLLRRAADLERSSDACLSLGRAYRETGDAQLARLALQEAVELDPENAIAHDVLGEVLSDLGESGQALEHFHRSIELAPRHAPAHFHLAVSTKSKSVEQQVSRVESLLTDDGLEPPQRTFLHHALGNLYDRLERWDDAFKHYQFGNDLKPRPDDRVLMNSDRAFGDAFVEEAIRTFDRTLFETRRDAGIDSRLPVFVVGMPRSGTTLVEQILASHPEIDGAGELPDMAHYAQRLTRRHERSIPLNAAIESVSSEELQRMAQEHERRLRWIGRDAIRVVDKMPMNFLHLGLITLLFPRATILHCRRHPLDTCVSCLRKNLDWPFCDLNELAKYYRRYVRLMDHWKAVLPLTIHEIQYERLVDETEPEIRRIVGATGLDWDDRCLRFYETERSVRTPSKSQVRQPIYRSSIGTWKRYEAHLGPLLALVEEGKRS